MTKQLWDAAYRAAADTNLNLNVQCRPPSPQPPGREKRRGDGIVAGDSTFC